MSPGGERSEPADAGPARRRGAFVAIAWLVWMALLGAAYAWLPASPDQAIFDYAGWILAGGGRLYLDVAEQNFPGMMWLHALANALFGNHPWSVRVFDWLLLLPFCGVVFAMVRPLGVPRLPWLVVWLYPVMYATSGIWSAGSRDLVAAHALLAVGWLALRRRDGGGLGNLLAAGPLLAFAVMVRPTYALFPVLLVLADAACAWRGTRPWRAVLVDTAVLGGVSLGLFGSLAAVGASTGQLAEWYRLTVLFNLGVYSHSASVLDVTRTWASYVFTWHWYLAYGALGAFWWWRRGTLRATWFVVAATFVTAVASAYVQKKGFGYHFVGMLPALGVFAAFTLALALARAPRAVAAVLALVALAGVAKKVDSQLLPQAAWRLGFTTRDDALAKHDRIYADTQRAAELVAAGTRPDDRVLVWSRAVHVNYLAQRRSPTRFITVWMLDGMPPAFALGRQWVDEFVAACRATPPGMIVLDAPSDEGDGILARKDPSPPVRFLAEELRAHYERVARLPTLDVYRRKAD